MITISRNFFIVAVLCLSFGLFAMEQQPNKRSGLELPQQENSKKQKLERTISFRCSDEKEIQIPESIAVLSPTLAEMIKDREVQNVSIDEPVYFNNITSSQLQKIFDILTLSVNTFGYNLTQKDLTMPSSDSIARWTNLHKYSVSGLFHIISSLDLGLLGNVFKAKQYEVHNSLPAIINTDVGHKLADYLIDGNYEIIKEFILDKIPISQQESEKTIPVKLSFFNARYRVYYYTDAIEIFDLFANKEIAAIETDASKKCYQESWSSSFEYLAINNQINKVAILHIPTCKMIFISVPIHIAAIAWSSDDKLIAIAGENEIRIYEVSTQQCIKTITIESYDNMILDWSPDGKYLAVGSPHKIDILDFEKGEYLLPLLPINIKIGKICWAEDSSKVFTCSGLYPLLYHSWNLYSYLLLEEIKKYFNEYITLPEILLLSAIQNNYAQKQDYRMGADSQKIFDNIGNHPEMSYVNHEVGKAIREALLPLVRIYIPGVKEFTLKDAQIYAKKEQEQTDAELAKQLTQEDESVTLAQKMQQEEDDAVMAERLNRELNG